MDSQRQRGLGSRGGGWLREVFRFVVCFFFHVRLGVIVITRWLALWGCFFFGWDVAYCI
jgi:hypothetical protein